MAKVGQRVPGEQSVWGQGAHLINILCVPSLQALLSLLAQRQSYDGKNPERDKDRSWQDSGFEFATTRHVKSVLFAKPAKHEAQCSVCLACKEVLGLIPGFTKNNKQNQTSSYIVEDKAGRVQTN